MKRFILATIVASALAGCGGNKEEGPVIQAQQAPVAQQPAQAPVASGAAPVIVQAPQQQHESSLLSNLLSGGAGYMLGRMHSDSNSHSAAVAPRERVIERHYVQTPPSAAPAPVQRPAAVINSTPLAPKQVTPPSVSMKNTTVYSRPSSSSFSSRSFSTGRR